MAEWVNAYSFTERDGKTYMHTDHGFFVSDNNDGNYRKATDEESKPLEKEIEELQKREWC